jgi:hypothetical protein
VASYLYFSGWSRIEIVDLRDNNGDEEHQDNAGLAEFMTWAGFGAHDSLGVVRGVNSPEREVS